MIKNIDKPLYYLYVNIIWKIKFFLNKIIYFIIYYKKKLILNLKKIKFKIHNISLLEYYYFTFISFSNIDIITFAFSSLANN